MGTFTELVMAVEFDKDTDKKIIDVLRHMTREKADDIKEFEVVPDYEFFKTVSWWEDIFKGHSYYIVGDTYFSFRYDNISDAYYLTVRCQVKNNNTEIGKLLEWIAPYSAKNGFIGYFRHEEANAPTLIYFDDGVVNLYMPEGA